MTDTATVTGTGIGLPEGTMVQREWYFAGDAEWREDGIEARIASDGSFADAFPARMNRTYRYVAPGEGLRQTAVSASFQIADSPAARVKLNSTTAVTFPANGTSRTLVIHLDEGQTFTYFEPIGTAEHATDPTGAALPGFGPERGAVTNVAPVTGDYTITLERSPTGQPSTRHVTLSSPLVIPTELDAPSQDITGNLPGQVVELHLAAEGGSVISEYATPDSSTGRPEGSVSLLDSSGVVVPAFRRATSIYSTIWQLPATSGDYVLRITPHNFPPYLVARHDQAVLAAHDATLTLDGGPARASFDRRGRVVMVGLTVPAGLDVRITGAHPDHLLDAHLLGPDGEAGASLNPTEAGTYTLLASRPGGTGEVDFHASTSVSYDAAVDSTVPYDQGSAPDRKAVIRVPVTEGQIFSFGAFTDAGELCNRWVAVVSGSELIEWEAYSPLNHQPWVFEIRQTGELVLTVTPCEATGTFQLVSTTIQPSMVTGTGTTHDGYPTTTTRATFEVVRPGQVAIVEYDAGNDLRNRVDVRSVGTSFPQGATIALSSGEAGANGADGFDGISPETLETTYRNLRGVRYLYVYAGPTATGFVELELIRMAY